MSTASKPTADEAATKDQELEDVQAALGTIADALDAAYDLLSCGLTYDMPDRTTCKLPAYTANQLLAILKMGRGYARAEIGEEFSR